MESEGLHFLIEIALILTCAGMGGIVVQKFKQPVVLGQILAGLIIGPAVLNLVSPDEIIHSFAEIGVILLMFMAGMETDLNELTKSAGASSAVAVGGMVVPFAGGFIAVRIFFPEADIGMALFTGVVLTATSISITVQALREFNKIRSKTGVSTLGAAIIDDVLGIILLTFIIGLAQPDKGSGILLVTGKIVIFFVFAVIAGKIFMIFINKHSSEILRNRNIAAIAIIICFYLAFIAEEFGVAAIIGAYITGIVFSLTPYGHRIEMDVSNIAYTLFTPIFFVNIGLVVSFKGLGQSVVPVVVIIAVAVLGKIIGSGIGAAAAGFSVREILQIGIGMRPRAEVALIVANLGKTAGIINDTIFTASILMAVATTIITPMLLKKAYEEKQIV